MHERAGTSEFDSPLIPFRETMKRIGLLAALSAVPFISAQATEWGQCGVSARQYFS